MIFLRPRNIALLLLFFISTIASPALLSAKAKAGVLTGTITDATSNEPLPGTRIVVVGKHTGAMSDFDGNYKLRLEPGDYSLKITYVGYLDTVVTVTVAEGRQTLDIALRRNVKEVTVSSKAENGSDASALVTMRNSDNLINAVSARSIELSPDLDVADVSQRLSGVSTSRTVGSGDAQYAIIRGMDKRYNYTTINGVKIPSPDNKNNYVPLDIFPAELVDRVEVEKTLTPSMEGDAIGGAMNLVMKQAPDHAVFSVQAGTGYDDLFTGGRPFYGFTENPQTTSPRPQIGNLSALAAATTFPSGSWSPTTANFVPGEFFSATAGDRFFDDQSLGVIVAGSFQNTYRGANTNFWEAVESEAPYNKNAQGQIIPTNYYPDLQDFQVRTYSTLQTRSGAMLNADYRASETSTIQLFGMYADLQREELRDTWDTAHDKGQWPLNNTVGQDILTTNENQSIMNFTLSGKHDIFGDALRADWKIVYSRAVLTMPDRADLSLSETVNYDSTRANPVVSPQYVQAGDGTNTRDWTNSTDEDKSIYLDLKTTEPIFGLPVEFGYGGMYRLKTRVATYDEFDLDPIDNGQVYNGNVALDTFMLRNNSIGTQTSLSALNYQAGDTTIAWYVQGKFTLDKLSFIGGLRGEVTHFGWLNYLPATDSGVTGYGAWTDPGLPFFLLPSASFKYSPVDNQNWRLSYFRSTSYPSFYEYVYNQGVPGDDYLEVPNPYLLATTANNLDFRWELFPGGLDQLLVGAFYKQLTNPIEYTITFPQGASNLIYKPENLGNATNFGLELDFRKYFSDFGISGNYTYTNSAITTNKLYEWQDTTPNAKGQYERIDTVRQTRPLQGQSANIGNLSLLYRDFESGTDAQISAVYTGPNIVGVSDYLNGDVWANGFLQLDFSGEQRLAGNLVLYIKIQNILNTAREETIHQPYLTSEYDNVPVNGQTNGADILVRKELYDRTYILGIRFKM